MIAAGDIWEKEKRVHTYAHRVQTTPKVTDTRQLNVKRREFLLDKNCCQ